MKKSTSLIFESSPEEPYKMIFRVQSSDGRGPYRVEYLINRFTENPTYSWTKRSHSILSGHPNPDLDQGFDDLAREIMNNIHLPIPKFGFNSVDQLNNWFSDEELKDLQKMGFEIVVDKASKIWSSNLQNFYHPYLD